MSHVTLNSWLIACRSNHIRKLNKPLSLQLQGRSYIIFRDEKNELSILEDRCPHRHTPLRLGRIENGQVRCAYHGWKINASGRVTEIPACRPQSLAMPSGHLPCVKKLWVTEQQGFVWVTFEKDKPLDLPPRFIHYQESGWVSFILTTRFGAPISACLENFLDCPHASYVHKYLFRTPTKKAVRAVLTTLSDGAQVEFFNEPRKKSLVWWGLGALKGHMRHVDRFIAPRTSHVEYEFENGLHYLITSSCTEVGENDTLVHTVVSFRWPRWGWLVKWFFQPLAQRIIEQDRLILNSQYENIRRFGVSPFCSTEGDLLGRYIVAWEHAVKTGTPPPVVGEIVETDIYL